MPSPVGHFLGGVAAAWLVAPAATARDARARVPTLPGGRYVPLLFGIAGVAPDLDIVLRTHRTVTHSVGAALAVFLIALALLGGRQARFAAALAAAVASHFLLDLLSYDFNEPSGVMILWPFSREYFVVSYPLFLSISKDFWTLAFYTHNAVAIAREALILGPILALIAWGRSRGWSVARRPPDTRLVEEP